MDIRVCISAGVRYGSSKATTLCVVREDRDIERDGEVLVHSLPFRMTAVLLFGEDSCEELPLFVGWRSVRVRAGLSFFP